MLKLTGFKGSAANLGARFPDYIIIETSRLIDLVLDLSKQVKVTVRPSRLKYMVRIFIVYNLVASRARHVM